MSAVNGRGSAPRTGCAGASRTRSIASVIWRGVAASLLLAVAATFAASTASAFRQVPTLDGAASWLAMRRVSVHCMTVAETANDPIFAFTGALAYVPGYRDRFQRWHPYDFAVFEHGQCEALESLMADDGEYGPDLIALALLILTHESGHLRGHRWSADEAKTECWAIRHVGYVAHRLGVTDPAYRRLLVSWAVWYHRYELAPIYHQPGCVLPPHDDVD